MALDKTRTPQPPLQGNVTTQDLQRHAVDINYFLENLVVKGESNVTDATGSGDIVAQFNDLLTKLRNSGVLKV